MGHMIYCLTHTRLDVFVVCLFRLLTRLGTVLSPCDSSISVWDHGTERMYPSTTQLVELNPCSADLEK